MMPLANSAAIRRAVGWSSEIAQGARSAIKPRQAAAQSRRRLFQWSTGNWRTTATPCAAREMANCCQVVMRDLWEGSQHVNTDGRRWRSSHPQFTRYDGERFQVLSKGSSAAVMIL